MRKFADPKKPGGLHFTYILIDKRKISVLSEKSVGVKPQPTYSRLFTETHGFDCTCHATMNGTLG